MASSGRSKREAEKESEKTRRKRVSYTEAKIHKHTWRQIHWDRHWHLGSEMNVNPSKLFFSYPVVPLSWGNRGCRGEGVLPIP